MLSIYGIYQLATQYIKFPYTAEDQVPVKRGFHSIFGLPKPSMQQTSRTCALRHPYLNHKQYHSINAQLICDYQNHLLNVVPCFTGDAHDITFYRTVLWECASNKELLETHAHWYVSVSNYKFQQQRASFHIMTCFIRRSRICPGPLRLTRLH